MIRYANVNGIPSEPKPGLKGLCPGCRNAVIAKCGLVKIHHWAHKRQDKCDPWWEPMTQWHLLWQNEFPQEWRERILRDEHSKEFHRADVCTPDGLVIEFQHSVLSLAELNSRNAFYKKLIWVVNAQAFKDKFSFQDILNPSSSWFDEYDFIVNKEGFAEYPRFYKKAEYRDYGPAFSKLYGLNSMLFSSMDEECKKTKYQYKLFTWRNSRKAWLISPAPVFLDFGDDFLYRIMSRAQQTGPLYYLQMVPKKDFLDKYGHSEATNN